MSEYDITRAFKRIENDLIESMMRNLKRHKAEELKEGFNWEQWQALQLKDLERFRTENKDKFTGDFKDIDKQISQMLKKTSADAQAKQEAQILKAIKDGKFTPTQKKDVSFFNINEEKFNILLERTKADFVRAEYAVLRKAEDEYRKIIFDAQVYANVTNNYDKAVDMATHDFLKKGIQCVVYKNGAKHKLSDYSRMALKTANKRAYLMGEGIARDEYGIHTVQVNRRTQACPLCVGFLGKVLVDDVYSGGTRKEAMVLHVPTLSDAMEQGFLHPNCKDIYSTYIDGISPKAKPYNKGEVDTIVGKYNTEQQVNHAQDMVDSYQRMAKYSLNPTNQQTYQTRADNWQARIDEIKNTPAVAEPVITLLGASDRSMDFGAVFGNESVSYLGRDDTAHEIESVLVQLQERYPLQPSNKREFYATADKVIVTEYKDAWLHLPNGIDDRRLDDWAVAQVFQNEVEGKNQVVVAFNKGLLMKDTSIKDVIAERAKRISEGKQLLDLTMNNPTATAVHEWGHAFTEHMTNAMLYDDPDAKAYWEWYKSLSKEEIRNGISDYATESRGEFEAECFLELQMPNPRPLAVKWWSYMEKVLAKGY